MIEQHKDVHERMIVERFDEVIFDTELMKAHTTKNDKYPKGYAYPCDIRGMKRFPEEGEVFQVRRVTWSQDGELYIHPCSTKYTKKEDYHMAMTSSGIPAKYIKEIFWKDGGNGKIVSNHGWNKGWANSKHIARVFISCLNAGLFSNWKWLEFRNNIVYSKRANTFMIKPNL